MCCRWDMMFRFVLGVIVFTTHKIKSAMEWRTRSFLRFLPDRKQHRRKDKLFLFMVDEDTQDNRIQLKQMTCCLTKRQRQAWHSETTTCFLWYFCLFPLPSWDRYGVIVDKGARGLIWRGLIILVSLTFWFSHSCSRVSGCINNRRASTFTFIIWWPSRTYLVRKMTNRHSSSFNCKSGIWQTWHSVTDENLN